MVADMQEWQRFNTEAQDCFVTGGYSDDTLSDYDAEYEEFLQLSNKVVVAPSTDSIATVNAAVATGQENDDYDEDLARFLQSVAIDDDQHQQ